MRRLLVCVLALSSLAALTCYSQQTEIPRYSAYGAFSYFSTPSLNLTQRGFDGDFGVNMLPWLTLGGDFSYGTGSSALVPNDLNQATKAMLAPFLPLLPPGYVLAVPYNATDYTYEAGPQFNYRHFQHVTLFARPALGAIHSHFTAKPADPIQAAIVNALLHGSTSQSDTVVFYGFGGGVTWEVTPNFGLRVASDFVHYNFFSNILDGGRNSVRVTVGTKFSFGRNIVK
ncbi:MAG TPA: outer membrane beta-barrel protein [Terriglobales bacterium]|jgi:hypothetical protein|nr:outer membrane beta-barrel protein [Terriglobales bacterium]